MTTLASEYRVLFEVRKSKFLANASGVTSPEEALAFLEKVRDPKATHNCWAYKTGALYRFSDDGEPGGTAGQPIFRAIESQGLDGVMVVVTRYFGGVKLGTGGLARAYGHTAAECLKQAPKREIKLLVRVRAEFPFELLGSVYAVFEKMGLKGEKVHQALGSVGLETASPYWLSEASIEAAQFDSFKQALQDATRGRAKVSKVE
ncbi:MAG: IMPACT family protein [Deinococcus sp.]|nr:IMPACT family protein [Deinococcus sp.]